MSSPLTIPPRFLGFLAKGIVIASCLLLIAPAFPLTHGRNAVKGLSKAYGFLLAQEYSLNRISLEFPDLAPRVAISRAAFSRAFGPIKNQVEVEIRSALSEPDFATFYQELQRQIMETLRQQTITRAAADNFLNVDLQRAKGEDIERDVLAYLLAVRYQAQPQNEYIDGWRQRFQTESIAKSRGLQVNLQMPLSWEAKDGERPHVVQKWINEGGTGYGLIFLMVYDSMPGEPTPQEIRALSEPEVIKDMIPDGGRVLSTRTFSLENRTGVMAEVAIKQERAGVETYQRTAIYFLFFRHWSIQLMCGAINQAKVSPLVDTEYGKLNPVCQQVLNSIVLPQAYQ